MRFGYVKVNMEIRLAGIVLASIANANISKFAANLLKGVVNFYSI